VGDLALLVRNSVSKIKDDFILHAFATLEQLRRQNGLKAMAKVHLRQPQSGMIVTNLSRLPIREIDFSAGAPSNFLVYAEVSSSAAILPVAKGVAVLVVPPFK